MNWKARLLLILPFIVAAALTILAHSDWGVARSHGLEKYIFLFALPWAWLIDSIQVHRIQNHIADTLVTYVMLLWLPAFLHSLCIGAIIRLLGRRTRLS